MTAAMQREFEARLRAVETRLAKLETLPTKPGYQFKPGDRVVYAPRPEYSGMWQGTVIPLPVGYPSTGLQGAFTYVLRDRDNAIRGCYASNLVLTRGAR